MNKRRKKSYCFNCNTSLGNGDNFCRKCGQENHNKTVEFKHLINDFLGDYLTFDSKIWKSLKLLCFSPGQLTINYSAGKINSYIRPIRLMLFLSLIYVVVFSFQLDHSKPLIENSGIHVGGSQSATASYKYIIQNYENIDVYIEQEKKYDSYLNKALIKGVYNLVGGNKNIFNEALKKTSNLLFIILPFVGLIFKVNFWRNHLFYVEHFVHALHLYSFFFLIAILGMLLSWVLPSLATLLLLFTIFFTYLYFSYKKVYKRSTFITLVKILTTSITFVILLATGFVISLLTTISFS